MVMASSYLTLPDLSYEQVILWIVGCGLLATVIIPAVSAFLADLAHRWKQ